MSSVSEDRLFSDAVQKVLVKNNSGEAVPPHAAMKVTDWEVRENFGIAFISKPDTTFERHYLVNGPFAIPDGKWGEGSMWGITDLLVEATYDSASSNDIVGPEPGQWTSKVGNPGFRVVPNSEQNLGIYRVVRAWHDPPHLLRGKASGSIAVGGYSSATIRIKDHSGTEMKDGPWSDVSVSHMHMTGGTAIDSGVELLMGWLEDGWGVVDADCNPDVAQAAAQSEAVLSSAPERASEYVANQDSGLASGTTYRVPTGEGYLGYVKK